MFRARFALLVLALFATALIAGCGSDSSDEESTGTTPATADCSPGNIGTFKDDVLTVGTDRPAFPPYFEDDDPTNGKGFESALAYSIAEKLGFSRSGVEWTTVPFNSSFAPGPKRFDFDVNQISITPAREKAVDFSIPYYATAQAVLVAKDSGFEEVTSLDGLKDAGFGAQVGSTSLDAVNGQIRPTTEPEVFETSGEVISALKQGKVDAIVIDLPTAISLLEGAPGLSAVGQFAAPGGDEWGALLEKDSPLTGCVNLVLREMIEDGTLDEITKQWMSDAAGIPELS